MKLVRILLSLLLITTMWCGLACEENSTSSIDETSEFDITKHSTILYINNQQSQLELNDGWTLNLIGTLIYIQRPDCSGFELGIASNLLVGEQLEYTYIDNDETDYSHRTVTPIEIKQFNSNCLSKDELSFY